MSNELQYSDYLKRWKNLSDKELIKQHGILLDKINSVSETKSYTTKQSLYGVLELMERYMVERGLF